MIVLPLNFLVNRVQNQAEMMAQAKAQGGVIVAPADGAPIPVAGSAPSTRTPAAPVPKPAAPKPAPKPQTPLNPRMALQSELKALFSKMKKE